MGNQIEGRRDAACEERRSATAGLLKLALATGLIAIGLLNQAEAATLTATLIEDTYIEASNNVNYSTQPTLNFRTFSSVWRNPLIQFDLPILPHDEKIVKVELILTSASNPAGTGGTPDIEVVATSAPIDLTTITSVNSNPTYQTGGQDFTSRLLWSSLWTNFSSESVIPGADFAVGETVIYEDADVAAGMMRFVRHNISGSVPVRVTFGLGFTIREGNEGTTSTGWTLHSKEGSGMAPILRITTETVPEPTALVLAAICGAACLLIRRRMG